MKQNILYKIFYVNSDKSKSNKWEYLIQRNCSKKLVADLTAKERDQSISRMNIRKVAAKRGAH